MTPKSVSSLIVASQQHCSMLLPLQHLHGILVPFTDLILTGWNGFTRKEAASEEGDAVRPGAASSATIALEAAVLIIFVEFCVW